MDGGGGTTTTRINAMDDEVNYSPRAGWTQGNSLNAPNCANITNLTSITLPFQGHKIEVYGDLANNTAFGTMNVNYYLDDNSTALASTAPLPLLPPLLFKFDNIEASPGVTTNLLKIEVEFNGTNWFCVDHFMVYHVHQEAVPSTDSTAASSTNTADLQTSASSAEQTLLRTTPPISIQKHTTTTFSGTSTATSESSPRVETIPTPTTTPPSQKNVSKGGIAGGVVGGIVFTTIIAIAFLIWRRRCKTRATPVLDKESTMAGRSTRRSSIWSLVPTSSTSSTMLAEAADFDPTRMVKTGSPFDKQAFLANNPAGGIQLPFPNKVVIIHT